MNTLTKQAALDALAHKIKSDDVCPELAAQATQLVFGDGDPAADIVFIGEAPGKNEDEQGKPFVGAAGKFLNEMLEMISLSRAKVYITNIVKYRPPHNRDPLPEEKQAFLPYLQQQIDIIKPKLIVTLGRHSMDSLLPGLKISQSHGQPKRVRIRNAEFAIEKQHQDDSGESAVLGASEQQTDAYVEYDEGVAQLATTQRASSKGSVSSSAAEQAFTTWVILPLFHPAAALYNGGLRQTLIDDFHKIPAILERLT